MNKIVKRINAFDLIVILFCILTGVYILASYKQLQNVSVHLLIRLLLLSVIYVLLKTENTNNKILVFVRNFYPLLFLGFFYSETDYYNNIIFANLDPVLVKLENILFGFQPSLQFSKLIPNKWFSELMHFGYFSYYLMTLGVPLLFYLKAQRRFEKTMFIVVLSFCLYYLTFIIFPSIGPQFYFPIEQRTVPDAYFFQKIMHLIITLGETETGAFPSSHVGMAIVFLIIIRKRFKNYCIIVLPLVTVIILSTIYLKAHYTIDILGGIITGFIFYIVSNRIYTSLFNKKVKK